MKYKVYNPKDFTRLMKKNGYVIERYNGTHEIWVNNGKHIIVPKSHNPMILRRLIKENNLKEDE